MHAASLLVTLCLLSGCREKQPVFDLDGVSVDPLRAAEGTLLVLVFLATDCPISNRYAPELRRLTLKFASQGVHFFAVFPDADTGPATIRKHLAEYDFGMPGLRDPHHRLVSLTKATITPEAAVLRPDGLLLYRGRIDDLYPTLGRARREPTTHDLESALDRALSGQGTATTTTTAVGCFIGELE